MRRSRVRAAFGALATACVCAGFAWPAAAPAQPLATGISGMGPMSPAAFAEVGATGSHFVRITVPWQHIAPKTRPANWSPENPADPNYSWDFLDNEVRETVAAGFTPLLLVEGAPTWAQRCTSPKGIQFVEMCDPDPPLLGQFATATARRYNGSFGNLPKVTYWQGLNEPNLTLFFYPQFSAAGKPLSAELYRPLINTFYNAVKGVDPTNLIVMGGLGPIAIKGYTIGPMQFTRELLCMKGTSNPKPNGSSACNGGVHFDIFDIHPYTTGAPTHKGKANDVQLGDMGKVQTLIKAADRAGHIQGTRQRTEIWVAEFSYDSKPPDPGGLAMKIETRWIAEALHVSWQAGVSNFFWYSLRDDVPAPGVPYSKSLQAGLFFRGPTVAEDKAKPAIKAFRFPFVAYPRKQGNRLDFWGRTPTSRSGNVEIQVEDGGKWHKLQTVKADKNGIFRGFAATPYGKDQMGAARAVFRGERSAGFSMKPVKDFHQPPFG